MPQTRPDEPSDLQSCLDAAYRYLSLRPRSEFEVRSTLKKRGFHGQCVDRTLTELRSKGFLDDSSFARFWAENRQSFSPRGRALLRVELRQKGVAPEVIREAIEHLNDDENAYRAARKKLRNGVNTDYLTFRRSLGGFLRRRGFSYDVCQRVLDRLWHDQTEQS